MVALHDDHAVRVAAFNWLDTQVQQRGDDVLPRDLLAKGFNLEGDRIPLLGPQGIFKPKVLEKVPLSITTVVAGPYDDSWGTEGLLHYRYRGTDPNHRDNVGLREAMLQKAPLVYFHGVVKGKYLAIWPVFVVGDDPGRLTFTIAADDVRALRGPSLDLAEGQLPADAKTEARREYITATVRQRLHQRGFRERVLRAYREHCAICHLRHHQLLDAAHIIPDTEGGDPTVPNGLALCKLHHAAFDRNFLGIRPDCVIEIRNDVLQEEDGPMLVHGLQRLHKRPLLVPRASAHRPNPEFLARRYERFQALQ